MRFLYLLILISLIGCGTTKEKAAINNSVFKKNLSVKKSVFSPFVFDKILISSKVNFQYNQQFLTFDLTSRIDSGSKILFSGNLFLPIFKILIDNDRAYGYDRITKSFFESSVDDINKKYINIDKDKCCTKSKINIENNAILNDKSFDKPFFLSGGLSLNNLSNINMIKDNEMLYGLDLNSKFEKSPGLKDKEKIDKLFNLDL